MNKKLLALILTIIVLLLTGCNNNTAKNGDTANPSENTTSFASPEEEKQYMMNKQYNEQKEGFIEADSNIEADSIYIDVTHEISLKEFEYTAADFGITDTSEIKEIRTYWATMREKTDPINGQTVRITFHKSNTEKLNDMAKKIYELPFVKFVSVSPQAFYDEQN